MTCNSVRPSKRLWCPFLLLMTLMKKRGLTLYRSPSPNLRVVRNCNSAGSFLFSLFNFLSQKLEFKIIFMSHNLATRYHQWWGWSAARLRLRTQLAQSQNFRGVEMVGYGRLLLLCQLQGSQVQTWVSQLASQLTEIIGSQAVCRVGMAIAQAIPTELALNFTKVTKS